MRRSSARIVLIISGKREKVAEALSHSRESKAGDPLTMAPSGTS
jgi:hypothetical protein